MPAHSTNDPKCRYCGGTLDWNEGFFGRLCEACLREVEEEERERREAERPTIDDDFDDSDNEDEQAPRSENEKKP